MWIAKHSVSSRQIAKPFDNARWKQDVRVGRSAGHSCMFCHSPSTRSAYVFLCFRTFLFFVSLAGPQFGSNVSDISPRLFKKKSIVVTRTSSNVCNPVAQEASIELTKSCVYHYSLKSTWLVPHGGQLSRVRCYGSLLEVTCF